MLTLQLLPPPFQVRLNLCQNLYCFADDTSSLFTLTLYDGGRSGSRKQALLMRRLRDARVHAATERTSPSLSSHTHARKLCCIARTAPRRASTHPCAPQLRHLNKFTHVSIRPPAFHSCQQSSPTVPPASRFRARVSVLPDH